MSVRTSKGQTKAAKGTEPKLVKNLKVARRSRVSKKAVAFAPEPTVEAPKAEERPQEIAPVISSLPDEINGAQRSMQAHPVFQSAIYFDGGWCLDM